MRKFKIVDRDWDADGKPIKRITEVYADGFRIERSGSLVFYVGTVDTHAFRSFDYVEEAE